MSRGSILKYVAYGINMASHSWMRGSAHRSGYPVALKNADQLFSFNFAHFQKRTDQNRKRCSSLSSLRHGAEIEKDGSVDLFF
jgi:hypothetical protein